MPVLNSGHTKQILVLMRVSKPLCLQVSVFRCRRKARSWRMELLVQPASMRRHRCILNKQPWPFLLSDLLRTCMTQTGSLFFFFKAVSGIKLKLPSVGWSGGRRDSWEVHRARACPRAGNLLYCECRSSVPISARLKGNFGLGVKGEQMKLNLNAYKIVSVLGTGKVDKAERRQRICLFLFITP